MPAYSVPSLPAYGGYGYGHGGMSSSSSWSATPSAPVSMESYPVVASSSMSTPVAPVMSSPPAYSVPVESSSEVYSSSTTPVAPVMSSAPAYSFPAESYSMASLSSSSTPVAPVMSSAPAYSYPAKSSSMASSSSSSTPVAPVIGTAPGYSHPAASYPISSSSSTPVAPVIGTAPGYSHPVEYSSAVSSSSSTPAAPVIGTAPGYAHSHAVPSYSYGTSPAAPSKPVMSTGVPPVYSQPSAPVYSYGSAAPPPKHSYGTAPAASSSPAAPVYSSGSAPVHSYGTSAPSYSYSVVVTPSGSVLPYPSVNSTGVYPYSTASVPGYAVPSKESESYSYAASTSVVIETISVVPTPASESYSASSPVAPVSMSKSYPESYVSSSTPAAPVVETTVMVTPVPASEYYASMSSITKTDTCTESYTSSIPASPVQAAGTKVPPKPGSTVHYTPSAAPGAGSPYPPSNEDRVSHGYPPLPSPSPSGGVNAAAYSGPAHLPKTCHHLTPALPQNATNGNSTYGTPDQKPLPSHAPKPGHGGQGSQGGYGSMPPKGMPGSGSGSGNGYSNSSMPMNSTCSDKCPDTGVTRYYDFTVSYMDIAPDGVKRKGVVVNGQFPGPLIEANCGDNIIVKVTNELDDEGTSMHWHGLLQKDNQFMDGVPSVTMCPIIPGNSFTYSFKAERVGTSWYHSHYSAQYSGGAFGPMVFHGCDDKKSLGYDIDLGPIMVSDWFHDTYYQLVNGTMNAPKPLGRPPGSDNILIQGKNNFPCANATADQSCTPNAGLAKFKFESGKKHLLRLINPSADAMIKFSIDGHDLQVISNDYVAIEPYTTNVVTLAVGQRAEIIVEGKMNMTSVWMRADTGPAGPASCSNNKGISTAALAAIHYDGADDTIIPSTQSSVTVGELQTCKNDALSLTVPTKKDKPDPEHLLTQRMDITFINNGTNFVWAVDNSTFIGDYSVSLMEQTNAGNLTFEPEWNVINTKSHDYVRFVVYNHFPFTSHPMHMHGHDIEVLEEGFGTWNGTITNPNNPARRDVHVVQKAKDFDTPAYAVYQWEQDNAGVWPFHCHIAWHVSAGLYVNILEKPDVIKKLDMPSAIPETCKAWADWSSNHFVNQIDSGL